MEKVKLVYYDELTLIQQKIIDQLQEKGSLSRTQMVKIIKEAWTTTWDNLMVLKIACILNKKPKRLKLIGRPVQIFDIKEEISIIKGRL